MLSLLFNPSIKMKKKNRLYYLALFATIFLFISANGIYNSKNNAEYNDQKWQTFQLISISDTTVEDLHFLNSLLDKKRFALLGESSHGVNEYSQIKLRLIKYLHKHLGFNTIFFESGISECAFINEKKNNLSPKEMLKNALFDVWHSEQNIELMQYIKENHIQMYGIDNQYTSNQYSEIIKLIGDNVNAQDALRAYTIDTLTASLFRSKEFRTGKSVLLDSKFETVKSEAHRSYTELISKINVKLQNERNSDLKSSFLLLKKILTNKLYFIDMMKEQTRYFSERDKIMASNFKFLADTLNKNEKIIVWAHNSHISKTGSQNPTSYLGQLLQKEYDSLLYGVGLYVYQGELADNFRRGKIKLTPLVNNGLEYHLHELRKDNLSEDQALFLHFDRASPGLQYHWLQDTLPAFGWSTGIVPVNEYDAAVLIERAHAPTYID